MFKLDIEPISPRLKNNRDAHEDYLKKTIENTDTIHGLVERLENRILTCPGLTKPSEKLVVVPPLNKDKKVRFADLITSSSNTQSQVKSHKTKDSNQPLSVKSRKDKKNRVSKTECNADVIHSMLNVNSKSLYAICNECLFDANHDECVLDYVHDVNVLSKSKPVKHKNKTQVWKPTGKVYTEIGYKWKPTKCTFTIVRNKCPLTRFTSTKVVPLKETTIKSVLTPTQGIKSECSKHMTGNRSQLTNFINKFLGTVKFGNDKIAKIIGYGDYQIGNATISRVYYVEGLGHNLFVTPPKSGRSGK
ncbi:hypothetical protein Tco_0572342, partial [Tanacetum coccineum]